MSPCNSLPAAVIFDMDGILVDSNPFHLNKWVDLLNEHHIPFNPDELREHVVGHRNDTIFKHFFGPDLSEEERQRLGEELEERFRRAFRLHARPLAGLDAFAAECWQATVPMAVASAAMTKNVEFVIDALGFRAYFQCVVTGDEVTLSKPDPEIYLKTAAKLGLNPASCAAFEDSFVGVESAKRAGIKCVAIASSFPFQELREQSGADLTVRSFEEVTLARVRELFTPEK